MRAEAILDAFLAIGDKSVAPAIRAYMRGTSSASSKAVARRVLVQLEDPDPVSALAALLEAETDPSQAGDLLAALSTYRDARAILLMSPTWADQRSATQMSSSRSK